MQFYIFQYQRASKGQMHRDDFWFVHAQISHKIPIFFWGSLIASYVYILSGQKFIKIAKNSQFGEILKKCDILSNLQTLCLSGKFKMYLG